MPVSKSTAKRVLKQAGAKRVSDTAATELADTVNGFAYSLAKKAVDLAAHAKRETVRKEDIELAK
ncbi:MAG: NFYB/HAP3 family transcription factor subunit [Candidatus Micrarchaeota archaeon]|nr:NFYB/HAP3 family transcription factor subunit [Candidatus Micrarchaeota archaeon]MDE1824167.1 NFYB/HAP3 family transcription factor subunit [Candidatus Micrarchaeota archaeon]MDE1849416.1 NFYB/HAP3 family transcription factor subunit [Candidatus Micrarchaeota archaeon]